MIKTTNSQFGKPMYILNPGDYFASTEDCIIATVTGSCVAVCLYDTIHKLGGMRHLIVPGTIGTESMFTDSLAAQAIANMEFLLGDIVKYGGNRKYLIAKIFGAAYLTDLDSIKDGISMATLRFLHEYFSYERIPVINEDLGGRIRRKIYFMPNSGKIFRKLLKENEDSSEFIKMEQEYIESVKDSTDHYGKVILF